MIRIITGNKYAPSTQWIITNNGPFSSPHTMNALKDALVSLKDNKDNMVSNKVVIKKSTAHIENLDTAARAYDTAVETARTALTEKPGSFWMRLKSFLIASPETKALRVARSNLQDAMFHAFRYVRYNGKLIPMAALLMIATTAFNKRSA